MFVNQQKIKKPVSTSLNTEGEIVGFGRQNLKSSCTNVFATQNFGIVQKVLNCGPGF